jgi:hypothetical protein
MIRDYSHLNVRVPAELKAKLEKLAAEQHRSLSAYVALVLEERVKSEGSASLGRGGRKLAGPWEIHTEQSRAVRTRRLRQR